MSPQMLSLENVRRLGASELSVKARLGYVMLLLVATGMTVIVGSLWLTEAALPARTRWAFGLMSVIGLSWSALAIWALTRRRPLFARDRVVAGWLAVKFTSLFLAAGGVAALVLRSPAGWAVLWAALPMWAVALAVLARARRRYASLAARRAELER